MFSNSPKLGGFRVVFCENRFHGHDCHRIAYSAIGILGRATSTTLVHPTSKNVNTSIQN